LTCVNVGISSKPVVLHFHLVYSEFGYKNRVWPTPDST